MLASLQIRAAMHAVLFLRPDLQESARITEGFVAQAIFAGLAILAGLLAQRPAYSQSSTGDGAGLNYDYFKTKVEPIFLKKRPGHARCIACHTGGTASRLPLVLMSLDKGKTEWTEEQSKQNFENVKKVAFPGNEKSPLLRHPLVESAGGDFFHSGGKHFNSQDDPEWQVLHAFVMGQGK